jgi:hypothetical protein
VRTATEPRFAAKVEPRRRRKAGVVAELGQTAAILRARGAMREAPVAARALATRRAEEEAK